MILRNPILVALLAAALAAGCAKDRQPQETTLLGEPARSSTDPGTLAKDPPLTAQTHFAAGQFAEAERNFSAAAQQYEKACALQKDFLMAEYRLGVVYTHMKAWDRAIAAWTRYIDSTNGDASAWSNLGFCYELQGKPAKAEEAYKKAVEKDPLSQPGRVNYGLMLARNDRVPEAIAQLNAVLTPAEVHYNLASIYEQQGRAKLARAEYELAMKLDPQMLYAKSRLAALDITD